MKTTTFAAAFLAMASMCTCSLLPSDSGVLNHPQVSRFLSLPKFNKEQLQQITRGFYNLLEMHASHFAPGQPLERVLLENDRHLFATKIMNAVDGEIVGLKGDIKHSSKLTSSVGEILGTAKGYFDKVKDAKQKLENPIDAIGDAVKDSVGNALGGLTNSLGFRVLEEAEKKEGESCSGLCNSARLFGFETLCFGSNKFGGLTGFFGISVTERKYF